MLAALTEALAAGDPDALSIDELARRSGVHRTTIYRRWMSTSGAIADLLADITPVEVPLPDTGDLRCDLTVTAERVWHTLNSPTASTIVRRVAASTNPELAQAAQEYWSRMLYSTAAIVRRAQERGQAAPDIDPVSAIETLLAPHVPPPPDHSPVRRYRGDHRYRRAHDAAAPTLLNHVPLLRDDLCIDNLCVD